VPIHQTNLSFRL